MAIFNFLNHDKKYSVARSLWDACAYEEISEESEVGEYYSADGIKVLCVYNGVSGYQLDEQEVGVALFVDANHDLSYYVYGSDCCIVSDEHPYSTLIAADDNSNAPGSWGYEWGGYRASNGSVIRGNTPIGVNIGNGLAYTDSIIEKDLLWNYDKFDRWITVWDAVKAFRKLVGSDQWFVPCKEEADLLRNYLDSLKNVSKYPVNTSIATGRYGGSVYWTSTEVESTDDYAGASGVYGNAAGCAYVFYTYAEPTEYLHNVTHSYKDLHTVRTRLFRVLYYTPTSE